MNFRSILSETTLENLHASQKIKQNFFIGVHMHCDDLIYAFENQYIRNAYRDDYIYIVYIYIYIYIYIGDLKFETYLITRLDEREKNKSQISLIHECNHWQGFDLLSFFQQENISI